VETKDMPGERGSRTMIIIVVVLLLAAVVGGGVYWWMTGRGAAQGGAGAGPAASAAGSGGNGGAATVGSAPGTAAGTGTPPAAAIQPVTPLGGDPQGAAGTPAQQTAARLAELVQSFPVDTPLAAVATLTTRARHPIEPPAGQTWSDAPPDAPTVLDTLFGRKTVLTLLQTGDFARRFVATVDSLGREHSPPMMWPVNPTEGRFAVQPGDKPVRISPDNGGRYTTRVLMLETVDLGELVTQYRLHYPTFQRTYEELGFPKRYFNDRLVQVIDQLLRTPSPVAYPAVELPVINGPVQPERPWVMYEFMDQDLAELTSGQKLMLRMGPDNMRRVKDRLQELRSLIATPAEASPQQAAPKR
jgi:hypothetical protein